MQQPIILTMRKRYLISLIAAILLSTFSIKADDETATTSRVVWGIKGNLNAELPGKLKLNGVKLKSYNSGFGASIGGLANIYLGRNFYFEPEVSLFYEGYTENLVMNVAPNSPAVNVGPHINKLGFRVPLVFGYNIDISEKWGLNVFTGPQFNYAFYGKATPVNDEYYNEDVPTNIFEGPNGQKRFDMGWKIGVGFPVEHFMISLEADLGITNLEKNNTSFRENRLGLGITYYF